MIQSHRKIVIRFICFACLLLSGCFRAARPSVDPRDTQAISHPSSNGVVEANRFDDSRADQVTSVGWFSVTELSDQRVCVERAIGQQGRDEQAAKAKIERLLSAQPGMVYFNGAGSAKVKPSVEVLGPILGGKAQAERKFDQGTPTGRMETVCVEEMVNKYGTVVGCAAYEEQEIVDHKTIKRVVDVYTYRGALRWCADSSGLVDSEDTHFDFTSGGLRRRLELNGGTPRQGSWGGVGGISAIEYAKTGVMGDAAPAAQ